MIARRVGIIGLGEAGNLGDDLILIAAVRALLLADPRSAVTYLSNNQRLDWPTLAEYLSLPRLPQHRRVRRELLWLRDNRRIFSDFDLILFGGGGLLQTSHEPDRIYDWLSYLPDGRRRPPVLAVAHGLGPIDDEWIRRLRSLGDPFNESWVRDEFSQRLCREALDWNASVCLDFVDSELLAKLTSAEVGATTRAKILGVALRAWPELDVSAVAAHIIRVAEDARCHEVEFFVLEARSGTGRDVEVSSSVARALGGLPWTIRVYRPTELMTFLAAMRVVHVAISMKLHSCAVWSSFGVPIYPIYYAPKVSSFFGQQFDGFKISYDIMVPFVGQQTAPSATDIVLSRYSDVLHESPRQPPKALFKNRERAKFQLARVGRSLRRRVTALTSARVKL